MTIGPKLRAGVPRVARTIRKGGLLVVATAAIAWTCPATASAQADDPAPCGPPVDKGYPVGWVQYCPLRGSYDAWVPVYSTRSQGSNRIGTDIVGWLTHRGSVNWFWCQTGGDVAWNEWSRSNIWAKTLTDIEPAPPYRERHVQGWVPETFFSNYWVLDEGTPWFIGDAELRWADC